jgi:hypothetical protein
MRQYLLATILVLAPLAAGWALGNPEAGDYKSVQGRENWDARIDIAGMKAGKYNLIVRGTDSAGNVRYEGPYNVFVDPNSDLPVVHISHPTAGARVGTLLHVVGTSLDDDGVKSVMVQLDEQDPVPATGTEFWSFALDVAAVQDGEHTLTAKAIDINGTEGRAQTVRFQIDKKAPAIRITSHPSGSLVTGQVTLDGEVEDANGVASLTVSRDGGKSWEPLKPSLDKPGRKGTFRVGLDTRKIADGPQVLSFKAVDRTGSISQVAFLLFVNNDAPVLEILSPADDAAVNGKILVSGRASDKIGLKSLQYDLGGGEAGTIELAAGNPFWTQELDFSAKKAGALQATYTLENLTGNKQVRKLKLRVDPEKDRPVLTVSTPAKGERVTGAVAVSGFVRDDDAVERIEYSLDGGSPVSLPAASAFSFLLGELAPGAHKLVLKSVDVNGIAGLPVEAAFTKVGPPPSIAMDSLVAATGSVPFAPGIVFPGDKDAKLTGAVRFSGAALQAEYGLQGAAAKSLALKNGSTADQKLFEVPLPKGLAAGRLEIAIKATDGFGGITEYRSFLFVGAEQGEPGIILIDSRLTAEGTVRLDERPLAGYATGGAIQKAELDPPTDLVRVDIEGPVFRVTATASGASAPTRIKITAAGGSAFATEPIRFITDFAPPEIVVETPRVGDWLSKEIVLKGAVSDAGSVAGAASVLVEYSLDGGTFTPVETKAEAKGAAFGSTVPLGTLADGPHLLVLRATDKAGNASLSQIPFLRDNLAPGIVFVAPRAQDEVNGLITIVGRIEDAGDVAMVEVTEDGKSWREVGRQAAFRFDVNLSLLDGNTEALQVRCTDAAGNAGLARPQLTLNLAADVPVAQIQLPADGELLRNDFVLSGMAFDDDGVKSISWRIDGGDFQLLPGGNNFSVPIALDQVTDNEHTVEVRAEDIGGLMSQIATSRFKVSRSDPISSLTSPGIADHVRDVVELKGTSSDPNGIAEVRISFDNGLAFYRAEGTESWRYRLNTRLLADGTQAVLVRATDATGAEGLYTTTINIDNSAPELVVDSPADGQVVSDTLRLGGRSVDSIGLASLNVSVAPISAAAGTAAKSEQAVLTQGGILAQDIDIRDLAPGWYNVQLDAADRAGNRSYVSRNFLKRASQEAERVELFFPAGGERLAGPFAVSGQVVTRTALSGKNAVILVDGQPLATAPISDGGYFHLDVDPGAVASGDHALSVEVVLGEGARLLSEPRALQYAKEGPWVSIGSFAPGDYVTGRPFLGGSAGWLPGDSASPTADASAGEVASAEGTGKDAGAKKAKDPKVPAERKVRLVEVSMDNGTTFSKAEGTDSWRYRLESQQLANGVLRLLVKATFAGGATAVTRTQLIVDTRAPVVTLMQPEEGARFNESVPVMGTASDESGLKEVAVSLREGDKSRYQVPSFIQGLYVDVHAMGATYWDAGLGLTFFDSNVKLQLQIGMSPPGRFSGFVMGAKLLANIATLPFGFIFGPSWDFFSMALAIGANFSYFTMSESSIAVAGAGLVLGGVVGQLEFAKVRIPGWRALNTWSLYTEYQLWFISSDVEGGTVSKLGFGMRVGLL